MHINFGKDGHRIQDTVVSAIFRQEGKFTKEDVIKKIDELCGNAKTEDDLSESRISDLVDYIISSFSMVDRIKYVGKGYYKVPPIDVDD